MGDGIAEVRQGCPGVLPPGPSPLLWEVIPRAPAVTVGVSGTQQRLGGVIPSAAQSEPPDPDQRLDLRNGGKVTGEPPRELMGDHHPHQVRTANREVNRDRGPGARTDHDGGLRLQGLQQRCGIGRVR
jgi:hypothetical protein